jgi:restriction system protein
MEYIKFCGIFRKIQNNYQKGGKIEEIVKDELKISESKTTLLAEKIHKIYDFESNALLTSKTLEFQPQKIVRDTDYHNSNIYSLDNLSGREFEEFLKWMFQELGYSVELTKITADSGIDLVIKRDNEKIAVQAKRYNRNAKVSNSVVLKTRGGMDIYKCKHSIIITTSYFTSQAREDAKNLNIEIWDRDDLSARIDEINIKISENNKITIGFPEYKKSLYASLLELQSMKIFEVKNRGDDGKYDIYKHGIKYPILSFRESINSINHLSFRIKNKEHLPEYGQNSWSLITNNKGVRYGPNDEEAYRQIIQYLTEFI